MTNLAKYGICPKCSGDNTYTITDSESGIVCECETTCKKCGHKNYWAHGAYMEPAIAQDSIKLTSVQLEELILVLYDDPQGSSSRSWRVLERFIKEGFVDAIPKRLMDLMDRIRFIDDRAILVGLDFEEDDPHFDDEEDCDDFDPDEYESNSW